MSDPVIRTEALTKKYGNATAVDALDLTVEAGERSEEPRLNSSHT